MQHYKQSLGNKQPCVVVVIAAVFTGYMTVCSASRLTEKLQPQKQRGKIFNSLSLGWRNYEGCHHSQSVCYTIDPNCWESELLHPYCGCLGMFM